MSKRSGIVLIGFVCFLLGVVVSQQMPFVYGQGVNAKKPVWKFGLDLKARQGGSDDFDKARKYGIEVFLDENTNNLVYISETGSIAVVPNK